MFFYLVTKKVASKCSSIKPTRVEPPTDENTKEIKDWVDFDYMCKNYILNSLADDLYDYYSPMDSAKEI